MSIIVMIGQKPVLGIVLNKDSNNDIITGFSMSHGPSLSNHPSNLSTASLQYSIRI